MIKITLIIIPHFLLIIFTILFTINLSLSLILIILKEKNPRNFGNSQNLKFLMIYKNSFEDSLMGARFEVKKNFLVAFFT